jgi:hypothetical protein
MSKQTAVQFLKESIDHELKSGTKMVVNWDMYLAMEREQTENAYDQMRCVGNYENGKQYYNETYETKTIK